MQVGVAGDQVDSYAKDLGQFIDYQGHSDDEQGEVRRLHDDKVDVVVVFPEDPLNTVLDGHQAVIKVVHNRLDPIEQTAIGFASQLAVDQINSQK